MLFEKAIHEMATSVSYFQHPAWVEFFKESSSSWNPPPSYNISRALLDDVCNRMMKKVEEAIQKPNGVVLGIEGWTIRLEKSVCNVIIHNTRPLFIEFLRSDFKSESTENAVDKIADVFRRLDAETGLEMTLYCFLSDSNNAMSDVRRIILEQKLVL